MPFGKFKGIDISDLPDDYLKWLASLGDLKQPLRQAIDNEVEARREPSTPSAVEIGFADEIISAGVKKLALRHHPDVGGTEESMKAVNRAGEILRRMVRSLKC
jgi:hypothetical protein